MTDISVTALDGSSVPVQAASIYRVTVSENLRDPPHRFRIDHAGGQQETEEGVARLLSELAAAHVRLVRLTTPAQTAVYLNPDAVSAVQPADAEADEPGALTAITVSGQHQAVLESLADVRVALGRS